MSSARRWRCSSSRARTTTATPRGRWARSAPTRELVWHAETELPRDTGAVVLPGGFSYGDYLRCGAIARFAPVLEAVRAFAADGGPVLGICNGFQILCEAGLLPGVLRRNRDLEFVCRDVRVRVERIDTPFTARCEPGQELTIPVKHGEGCWYADEELYGELEAAGQLVLRYAEDCNGSVGDVAGRLQRGAERLRPDAAPRACGRSAARLGRRRAAARRARRRRPRAHARACLTAPATHSRSTSSSPGCFAERRAQPLEILEP